MGLLLRLLAAILRSSLLLLSSTSTLTHAQTKKVNFPVVFGFTWPNGREWDEKRKVKTTRKIRRITKIWQVFLFLFLFLFPICYYVCGSVPWFKFHFVFFSVRLGLSCSFRLVSTVRMAIIFIENNDDDSRQSHKSRTNKRPTHDEDNDMCDTWHWQS